MFGTFFRTHQLVFRDCCVLSVLLACLFGYGLGNRPFSTPDEGRYVEIPREMVATGDFVTPRLNGVKYFEKPPLVYWLQAASIALLGINFWSMRLWIAFFAVSGCLVVYGAGRALFSQRVGLYAAGILSTTLLYYTHSRVILLDLVLSVWISITLFCIVSVLFLSTTAKIKKLLLLGAYMASALACLTKGLIGIFIPGLVVVCWSLLRRDFSVLRALFSWSGIGLFLLIAGSWHLLVSLRNANFAHFYFIHEHVLRYLTKIHRRDQPFSFFFPILLLGFLPWTSLIIAALCDMCAIWKTKTLRNQDTSSQILLFLVLWAGLVFLFFSFSSSKLIPYILPAFPPLALLCSHALVKRLEEEDLASLRRLSWIDILLVGALLIGARIALAGDDRFVAADHYPVLGSLAFFSFLAAASPLCREDISLKFAAWIPVLFLLTYVAPTIEGTVKPSVKPLAEAALLKASPQDRFLCLSTYFQDLPVYLERLVDIADWKGELAFGLSEEDFSDRIFSMQEFWKVFKGPERVFVFTRKEIYRTHWVQHRFSHKILAETSRDILFVNR